MYLSRNLAEKRKVTCPDSARPHETRPLPPEMTPGIHYLANERNLLNQLKNCLYDPLIWIDNPSMAICPGN